LNTGPRNAAIASNLTGIGGHLMFKVKAVLSGVCDKLLLYDPCLVRLIFASRAVLGLGVVAGVCWFLAKEMGHDLSGVMLGVVGAQFSLLLAREPSRDSRIYTSLIMIPGYWLARISHSAPTTFADQAW